MVNGTVVKIVSGKKNLGVVGKVFWQGQTRFGSRVGLKQEGCDVAIWVKSNEIQILGAPEGDPQPDLTDVVHALEARVAILEEFISTLVPSVVA